MSIPNIENNHGTSLREVADVWFVSEVSMCDEAGDHMNGLNQDKTVAEVWDQLDESQKEAVIESHISNKYM
jgi:hypothetical protein